MDNPRNEPPEDDEEWLPPPRRSPRWGVIIGILVLIVLIVVGGIVVVRGFRDGSVATVTPTPPPDNYTSGSSWLMPGMYCDQAVQKIEQNQIAYVLIYREKDGGPAIPANAITGIEILPRGIAYQGDPAQSVQTSLLQIFGTYPDHICNPQVLAAVKQMNKHLSKKEQVKVGWYYDLSG